MKRAGQVTQQIVWLLSVLASRMYLGVFFGLALWAVLPMVIHWQSTVVISGSMEPGVSTGDVIVAQTLSQDEIRKGTIKVGNVLLAENPDKPGTLITHRVIKIMPNGDFITKGDANPTKDSTPVPQKNVKGVERLLIPYIGIPIQTLRAGDPIPVAIFLVLTFIAQSVIVKDIKNERAWAKKLREEEASKKDAGSDDEPKKDAPKTKKKRSTLAQVAPVAGAALAVTAIAAALIPAATPAGFSHASFSASVPNAASYFNAAADWTVPTVTMVQPVSPLKGTVSITANAADDKSGVKNTVIQYQALGASTWSNLCTDTVAPYTCSWNTAAVTDGNYDLRAVTTDNVNLTVTSGTVRTTIANNMLVVLAAPADNVRGTVVLGTSLYNTGSVTYTVRVEYSVAGANSWKNICSGLTTPYNCSWNTTGFANDEYDIRSVAVSGGTTFTSQIITAIMVDNLAPTVVMTDPTTPITGNWTFAATASDEDSGIAKVTLQYAPGSSSTYTDLCVLTATPYSCRVDTLLFTNGMYTFRAIADDEAGNRTISALISNRVIDNTVSSASMEDPGDFLTGNVTLYAVANSTAGVSSVVMQIAPTGTTTWTTVCTFAGVPYTCLWNSATVANGSYSFRALLTDSKGVVTASPVVTSRQVDNLPLHGFDVQPASGTGTVGKMDSGDTMTFTYNSQVNLTTVTTGWTGASLPVTVRLRDGAAAGLTSKTDALDIQRTGGTVNLGSVNLRQDYIKNNKSVTYNATMVASTVMVDGKQATKITITLGTRASGNANTLRTVSATTNMIWTPSALVLDLNGQPSSVAPVTETGTLDRDF